MHRIPFFKPGLLASAALCSLLSAEGARQTSLSLDGGTVTFDVGTNISAVSVHGKSSNVRGLARLRKEGAQLILEDVAATLPVEALTTGMSLRDDHMKKYIFTTADPNSNSPVPTWPAPSMPAATGPAKSLVK